MPDKCPKHSYKCMGVVDFADNYGLIRAYEFRCKHCNNIFRIDRKMWMYILLAKFKPTWL